MERETIEQIAVSVFGVGVFVLAVLAIGVVYGDGALGEQGGLALVGAIVAFILLMAVVGVVLKRRED